MTFELYFLLKLGSLAMMAIFLAVIAELVNQRHDSTLIQERRIIAQIEGIKAQEDFAKTKKAKRKIKWLQKDLRDIRGEVALLKKRRDIVEVIQFTASIAFMLLTVFSKPFGYPYDQVIVLSFAVIMSVARMAIQKTPARNVYLMGIITSMAFIAIMLAMDKQ